MGAGVAGKRSQDCEAQPAPERVKAMGTRVAFSTHTKRSFFMTGLLSGRGVDCWAVPG